MTTATPPRACIACGAPPVRGTVLRNGVALLRCPSCRLEWWNWTQFDPATFYNEDYFQSSTAPKGYDDYAAMEAGLRRTARARLRRLVRLRRAKLAQERPAARADESSDRPALLDIGCGTGVFLDEARAAGFATAGVEVSAYAAARAAARGLRVRAAPIEALVLPERAFDYVTIWDVIEHVRHPRQLVEEAVRALRPGGVLALSTGDVTSWCARLSGARWHLYNLPEHLFFFSPDALRRLLHDAGAQVHESRYEVNWVPMAYLLERLGKSLRGPRPTPTASAPAAGGGVSRWCNLVVPATLFDVLGVYAFRT
ncbi:MAG: class I SAM-dependent methyltransferase [Phycisphaerae bacterium]